MAKCLSPIMVENPRFDGQDKVLPVRCGKCQNCLNTTINDWCFRLEMEAKDWVNVDFVTLTYSPKHVPLSENGLPTLDKRDLQKLWKKLRRHGCKIKYFAVGEYGSNSFRPHYHAIIFGLQDVEILRKKWYFGFVHVGDYFSPAAVRYTLKYMWKPSLIPAFKEDDRLKEFRCMSQKLGSRFMTDERYAWYMNDIYNRINYAVNLQGHKQTLPRYYRRWLTKWIDTDKLRDNMPERYEEPETEDSINAKNASMRRFERRKDISRNKL